MFSSKDPESSRKHMEISEKLYIVVYAVEQHHHVQDRTNYTNGLWVQTPNLVKILV